MSINFDGDEHADTASTYTPASNGSLMFWMYPTSLSSSFPQRMCGNDNNFEIFMYEPASDVVVGTNIRSGPTVSSTVALSEDTWYHVVSYWDSNGDGGLYINGSSDVTGDTFDSSPVTNEFRIGGSPFVASQRFIGELADLRIYDRVLNAAEIATIYACPGSDGITYGLLHRWKLDELPEGSTSSTAGIIKDCAISGFDADPSGTLTWGGSFLRVKRALRSK